MNDVPRLDVMHDTKSCEIKLQGSGPWTPVEDVTILHTPVRLDLQL